MSAPEAIAIVGIGCRLPGGIDSPEKFWEMLRDGEQAITEVPADRWDLSTHFNSDPKNPLTQHVRHGGFLEDINLFDPGFFGITPREAICMDPQQRLLLEVAWRSIEDAGHPLETLRGRQVGVFIGISSADYSSLLWTSEENYATPDNEPFILPGNTGCIAANRLSYFLDLKGPSFTVDTACSSSLVAVHLACESLWRGESELAFAGGVQALIHPGIQMSFCKAGLLSPDGKCKSFDAEANGYVRSEGAGVILLKPLSAAIRDKDKVHALIRGTAINSDGRSQGLAAPSQRSQMACVREAYTKAGINPKHTQYVEAHGTGTRQGDPIELRALGNVLGKGRQENEPCRVGSVKTNLGHGETAAGITGLIKAALCIREKRLPPSLHFHTPNPSIDFLGLSLKVQTKLEHFPKPDEQLVVGVSSFGFGGTNAHAVLTDPPNSSLEEKRSSITNPPLYILSLSARTPSALDLLISSYSELIKQNPQLNLNDLCASTNLGRSIFPHRFIAIGKDRDELLAQLNGQSPPVIRGEASLTGSSNKPSDESLKAIKLGLAGDKGREQLEAIAAAFGKGLKVDWQHLHSSFPYQKISVPGHPFNRQHFWWSQLDKEHGKASLWLNHLGKGNGAGNSSTDEHCKLKALQLPGKTEHFQASLLTNPSSDLTDHQIRNWVVFPAAGYIALALDLRKEKRQPICLKSFQLEAPLRLHKEDNKLHALLENETLNFHSQDESQTNWLRHGEVTFPPKLSTNINTKFLSLENASTNEMLSIDTTTFYKSLEILGLRYGSNYRPIKALKATPGNAWADLARPQEAPDRCLIDGCFQTVAACVDLEVANSQLFLPVGVDHVQLSKWPLPDHFQCNTFLRPSGDEGVTLLADMVLEKDGIPFGHLSGLRLRRLTRSVLDLLFPQKDLPSGGPKLFNTAWTSLPANTTKKPIISHEKKIVLIGPSKQSKNQLKDWANEKGLSVDSIPIDETISEDSNPIVFWPNLSKEDPKSAITKLLNSLQRLGSNKEVEIWLVLEGNGPVASALTAFQRTASLEKSDWQFTTICLPKEIQNQPKPKDWDDIWMASENHSELLWDKNKLHIPQLVPIEQERYRIASDNSGRIEGLHKEAIPTAKLLPGEIELAVEATGLNFRDVLNALGLLQEHASSLGLDNQAKMPFGGEAVGRVTAIGPEVDPELLGQKVVAALTVGSLASHVISRVELCVPIPPNMTPQEGASFSTAFLTAIHGLESLAKLKPGETVLIHAAAGGVGQAALQIAKRNGAHILATASKNKQAALLQQGIEAVFDSRSTDFADQVLAHTNNRGVDVVLNSLKGPWVEASFRSLSKGGRFIELGKIEIWSKDEAAVRRPDATYLPFDLLEVASANPAYLNRLLRQLTEDLNNGSLHHIAQQVWPLESHHEAFKYLAQAKHIGKVVISHSPKPKPLTIRPDASYLITGALGGIGLELLPWLVNQGARSLVLIGRSVETPSQKALEVLRNIESKGVKCLRIACDLSKNKSQDSAQSKLILDALNQLPSHQPLRGVFHAAGVLRDGFISRMDKTCLDEVLAPKLGGWLYLESLLENSFDLDFLVAFSSIASLLGSPGQAAYAAANSAMESYCKDGSQRPMRLAIQWGPWSGDGMASGLKQRFERVGVGMLNPQEALKILGELLERGKGGVISVLDNEWSKIASQASPRQREWFSELLEKVGPSPAELLWEKLQSLPESDRQVLLMEALRERLARVMASDSDDDSLEPESIDPGASLFNLGLDSLMAVEFAAIVQTDLGLRLDLEALTDDPSLDGLAKLALNQLTPQGWRQENQSLNLASEAQLPADWQCPSQPAVLHPGQSIFLTGASGFLGAFLLAGQLNRWPELEVRCLVRAQSTKNGFDRIKSNLSRYGLWKSSWEERISPILGDLALPRFGLESEAFDKITEGLGGILHNGAQLSQMASYAQLSSANVGGTKEILRLATLANPLRVEMISSVSVFEASAYRNREILESDDLTDWQDIHIGYSQTKWVSERLILEAGKAGLPIAVYRPPLIGGHSHNGLWHEGDLLQRLLQGCLALGKAPQLAWELDLVPVDYVADAVTALAWSNCAKGRCFHLQHPRPIMLNDLLSQLISDGAPLEHVSMEEWLEAISADSNNPLHPLRAFFQQRWGKEQLTYPELNALGVRARPSCKATQSTLEELNVRCPDFHELMGAWSEALLSGSLATSP